MISIIIPSCSSSDGHFHDLIGSRLAYLLTSSTNLKFYHLTCFMASWQLEIGLQIVKGFDGSIVTDARSKLSHGKKYERKHEKRFRTLIKDRKL